ncbi:hypothetical protein M422DRAFT_274225 [Sphaerobolus stellatus SS14]|uniref:Unplaced genomic scaffold SPHSTscaffold_374, whole genome shotgun sequence n=1 Tax=Sphaerobolus stellatus (strain SS14) TaxID=990650 RepID=A0A0C9TSV9_SPHS4|nr:hypothetical protein M422DRAFT_274225 [Sphaerobolus stellatus SS14]
MPTCFCEGRDCRRLGGRELTQRQFNQHLRDERVSSYRQAATKPEPLVDDAIKEEVFRMLFEQPNSERFPMKFEDGVSHIDDTLGSPTTASNPFKNEPISDKGGIPHEEALMKAALVELKRIQSAAREVIQTVHLALANPQLGQGIPLVPENHPLTPHCAWLNNQKAKCIPYQTIASPVLQVFAQSVLEEIDNTLNVIEHHRSAWAEPGLLHYDTGMQIPFTPS